MTLVKATTAGREDTTKEELREANDRFYHALEALDLAAMERLWLHEPWVRCIHPGGDVLVGWESVRDSWARIFQDTPWIRVTATQVQVQVFADVALVGCAENITTGSNGDVGVAVAQATNLFQRTSEGWKLVHHHASSAPVLVTQPFSGIVQ
jgi:ketosteroid isomerase-like protein